MSNSMSKSQHPPKYLDTSDLIPEIKTFYDNIFDGESNVKYRRIPVTKTFDTLKASGVLCENACGVKEVKNIGSMMRSNYYPNTKSIIGPKFDSGFSKQRSKLDTQLALKSIQRKLYSDNGPTDKKGYGSVSEPALITAKDRGDSVPFPDVYNDENFAIDNFGDGKKLQSMNDDEERCLKACIYIKKGGNVYKSEVEAINFEPESRDIFNNKPTKHKYVNNESPSRAGSKKKLDKFSSVPEKNCFKIYDESDDFEIAFFLSGVKNFSVGGQTEQPDAKTKQIKKEIRKVKKGKKEHNSKKTKDKRLESERRKYFVPSKLLKIDKSKDGSCSRLTYTVKKPRTDLDFSSKESDSDYEYDEGENIVRRRPKLGLDPVSLAAKARKKHGRHGILQSRYRYVNDVTNVSSSKISQSSVSQLSDIHKFPKTKISDVALWEAFGVIFRK